MRGSDLVSHQKASYPDMAGGWEGEVGGRLTGWRQRGEGGWEGVVGGGRGRLTVGGGLGVGRQEAEGEEGDW